jgi:hypothetical protein
VTWCYGAASWCPGLPPLRPAPSPIADACPATSPGARMQSTAAPSQSQRTTKQPPVFLSVTVDSGAAPAIVDYPHTSATQRIKI